MKLEVLILNMCGQQNTARTTVKHQCILFLFTRGRLNFYHNPTLTTVIHKPACCLNPRLLVYLGLILHVINNLMMTKHRD